MNSLTVSVLDEALSADIDGWRDGAEYNLRVRQDSPGQFTAVSAEEAIAEEPEPVEEVEPEMPERGIMGGKMPAVAIVIGKGRKA